MSVETNQSALLGKMAGSAGDYYISTTAVTTKKFSHIVLGPNGATVTVCKIRGVDVMAARNYGALPAGYVMSAGGDDYFDSITLTAGDAIGVLYAEDAVTGTFAVAVAGGVAGAAMTPVITFTNTGIHGSKKMHWRVRNSADVVVQSGEQFVYFLSGTGLTVNLAGLTYFATVATGYELDIRMDGSDVWTTSAAFTITAA